MSLKILLTALLCFAFFAGRSQIIRADEAAAFRKHYKQYRSALNAYSEHNYFYGIYRHQSFSLLHDKDSVLIHHLMQRAVAGQLPQHFYWDLSGIQDIKDQSDSVLVHGYPSILHRHYKAMRQLPKIYVPKMKPYHRASDQLPFYPYRRSGLPYYLQENRYKRLDEIRRNDQKE